MFLVEMKILQLQLSDHIKVLKDKAKNGLVTLNLWDLSIRTKKGKVGEFHSIYDANFKPTPAYNVIKNAIKK